MSMYRALSVILFTLCATSHLSWAEAPKFNYAKPEEAKADDDEKKASKWTAVLQAGLLLTTGNSSATTLSSGLKTSRRAGNNKYQLDLQGAFARSTIFLAVDQDGDGAVDEDELSRITQTSSQSWLIKTRYDRFVSEKNSLYSSASASADKPAGKVFVGSGQVGYSRVMVDTKVHNLTLESGYDFSYEDLTSGSRALSIHSVRVFAGYVGKLSEDTSIGLSTEALFNVNRVQSSTGPVERLEDTRFNNEVNMTTSIYGDLSFRFSFLAKYDNNPNPRPVVGDLPYAVGFVPLADRLDTRTEAAIIVSFL